MNPFGSYLLFVSRLIGDFQLSERRRNTFRIVAAHMCGGHLSRYLHIHPEIGCKHKPGSDMGHEPHDADVTGSLQTTDALSEIIELKVN